MKKTWNCFSSQIGKMDKRAKRLLVLSPLLALLLYLTAGVAFWLSALTGKVDYLLLSEDAFHTAPILFLCGFAASFVWDVVFRYDHI